MMMAEITIRRAVSIGVSKGRTSMFWQVNGLAVGLVRRYRLTEGLTN
jgi:hypothetical protein